MSNTKIRKITLRTKTVLTAYTGVMGGGEVNGLQKYVNIIL